MDVNIDKGSVHLMGSSSTVQLCMGRMNEKVAWFDFLVKKKKSIVSKLNVKYKKWEEASVNICSRDFLWWGFNRPTRLGIYLVVKSPSWAHVKMISQSLVDGSLCVMHTYYRVSARVWTQSVWILVDYQKFLFGR